jgi:hypothetical protein
MQSKTEKEEAINHVMIKLEAYKKVFAYAYAAYKENNGTEIGGYLEGETLVPTGLLITDIVLPKQKVTCGHYEVIQKGDWIKKFHPEKVVGVWHSHHQMGAFHSCEDENTLDDKYDSETKNGPAFGVSLVVAFPDKMKCYFQVFKPIKYKCQEIDIQVQMPTASDEFRQKCVEEVKKAVEEEKIKYNYPNRFEQGPQCGMKTMPSGGPETSQVDVVKSAENTIFDCVTGYNIRQLKEMNNWHPLTIHKELNDKLESVVASLKASPLKQMVEKDERTCVHQLYNREGRIICFRHGRKFDCSKCPQRDLFAVPKSNQTESSAKPVSADPESPVKSVDELLDMTKCDMHVDYGMSYGDFEDCKKCYQRENCKKEHDEIWKAYSKDMENIEL